jgi:VanZ family protein
VFAAIRRKGFAFLLALAFGSFTSLLVEWTQLSIPGRVGNLTDLFCNVAGTLSGAAAAFAVARLPIGPRIRALLSPRVLLVVLWVVWQAFLFLPRYGPPVDISQEVAGFLMLVLMTIPWKHWSVSVFLLAWMAFGELQPYQFLSPPQPFLWFPFESWFEGSPDSYYGIIFGKLFFYTAVLYMERRARMRWAWAIAAPALILALGEFAQCYLPGRTPETTDLVLLAIGAVLLNLTEPHNKDQT